MLGLHWMQRLVEGIGAGGGGESWWEKKGGGGGKLKRNADWRREG